MKKSFKTIFSVLALLAVAAACKKENPAQETVIPASDRLITIKVTAPGEINKVSLTQDPNDADGAVLLAWAANDAITVTGTAGAKEFAIKPAFVGQATAEFVGEDPGAGPYTIAYNKDGSLTQAADGSTNHLGYGVAITGADSYADVQFNPTWASQHSGSLEQSAVLRLRAKLPDTVADAVTAVHFKASESIFNGGKSLSVELNTAGDAGDDDIINVYATLAAGSSNVSIPAGTELLIQFQTSANSYDVYTAYYKYNAADAIHPGSVYPIKINRPSIKSFASESGLGTAASPYLIGDQNQLKAISLSGTKQYYKLVDDIDMTGVTTSLNSAGTGVIGLDGNGKVLSKLEAPLFDDLNGSVADLTIEGATVSGGSAISGILANTIKTAASTVTNVDINSSSITATAYSGGLIGQIDAANTSVANCKVSDTNVTGTLAGGVVGFANALVTMSGCTYSGGTVKGSARYSGGMVASTSNFNSIISDCHVENATISVSVSNNDFRAGGFIGLQQASVQVKGCSVGKPGENVTINLSAPASGKVYNVGGFVGVNYGTITQNSSVRTTAYVTITAGNTATNAQLNLGGFAGYNTGRIEYSDAIVTMTGIQGTYIGGFCGIILQNGVISNCTEIGAVSGNNYTGGFVGAIDSATTSITGCTSAGSVSAASSIGGFAGGCTAKDKAGVFTGNSTSANVTSSGSNFGGFIGNGVGTFTSNYATGNVASTGGGNGGGFAGGVWEASTGSVFSKNYATGNVSGKANLGGLIGYIGGNLTLSDCFATGNVGTSSMLDQKYGGLVGYTTDNSSYSNSITISNCYSTGNVEPSFAGGGLIGRIGLATVSVCNCAAWGATVKAHNSGSANWSSAAVVGVTFPTCTLTGNYRKPGMAVTAYWGTESGYTTQLSASFDHADVSSTHPLTDSTGTEMGDTATAKGQTHYPQYPYHGHYTSETSLSTLASTTLGWSSDIWDFSGPLPLLK